MSLEHDQLRGLDQVRRRLQQLTVTLAALNKELDQTRSVITWPSLMNQAQVLTFHLSELSSLLAAQRSFLRDAHAYPLPTFPGATHEIVLTQLLRKKLEPKVEEWVESHTSARAEAGNEGAAGDLELYPEFWNSTGPVSNMIVGPMIDYGGAFNDEYTIAEREMGIESVVTGLRRKLASEFDELDDSDEDSEDGSAREDKDEDGNESEGKDMDVDEGAPSQGAGHDGSNAARDKKSDVEPPTSMPLEDMIFFMSTGVLPSDRPKRQWVR